MHSSQKTQAGRHRQGQLRGRTVGGRVEPQGRQQEAGGADTEGGIRLGAAPRVLPLWPVHCRRSRRLRLPRLQGDLRCLAGVTMSHPCALLRHPEGTRSAQAARGGALEVGMRQARCAAAREFRVRPGPRRADLQGATTRRGGDEGAGKPHCQCAAQTGQHQRPRAQVAGDARLRGEALPEQTGAAVWPLSALRAPGAS